MGEKQHERGGLRWLARAWGAVGVVLAIAGIPGVVDDLDTWRRWLRMDAETFRAIWVALVVVSIGVPVFIEARHRTGDRQKKARPARLRVSSSNPKKLRELANEFATCVVR